jgi:hypothetical protein
MKKLIYVLLSVSLISTSVPGKVQASWFSDLMGGLFTVITAPIWIFCPENEFFKNQSPFRKKVWQEQEESDRRVELAISRVTTPSYKPVINEDEIIARAKKEIKKDYKERIKKLEDEIKEGLTKVFDNLENRLVEDERSARKLFELLRSLQDRQKTFEDETIKAVKETQEATVKLFEHQKDKMKTMEWNRYVDNFFNAIRRA